MRVGFVELGQMGRGMAASLLAAGDEVTVDNRTASKMLPLVERGARAAGGSKTRAGATPSLRCSRTTMRSRTSCSARGA